MSVAASESERQTPKRGTARDRGVNDRVPRLAEALVSLAYAQPDPEAYCFQFVDCLQLLACGTVDFRVRKPPEGQVSEVGPDGVLDRHRLDALELIVLGDERATDYPAGALSHLFGAIADRSPRAMEHLIRAVSLASVSRKTVSGMGGQVSPPDGNASDSSGEAGTPELEPLKTRLSDLWNLSLLPDSAISSGGPDPGSLSLHVRVLHSQSSSAPARADDSGASSGKEDSGRSDVHISVRRLLGGPAPDLHALRVDALATGHLRVAREGSGGLLLAIPAHVGGAPWLVLSFRTNPGGDGWGEVLRFYAHTFSPLASLIRSEAADAYLDHLGAVLRTFNPAGDSEGGLDEVNRRLWQLAHVYPYSPVRIRGLAAPGGESRLRRQRFSAEVLPERPIPAQVGYRPLGKSRILAAVQAELARLEQRWAEQTDALVGGIYKFSHQWLHHLMPVRNKIDSLKGRVEELDEEARGRIEPSLLSLDVRCSKAQRFAGILDVLSTATLNDNGAGAFTEKERSCDTKPLLIDRGYFDALAVDQRVGFGVQACGIYKGFVPLTVVPRIRTARGMARPSDDFYAEVFGEAWLNAAKEGIRDAGLRCVPVSVQTELLKEGIDGSAGTETLWAITLENPCRPGTAQRLQISDEGSWHEWPNSGDAPKGGLFFLGMLMNRTEIGRAWIRVRPGDTSDYFGLRFGLRWCRPESTQQEKGT